MNINFNMFYQKNKLFLFSGEYNGMYMIVLDIILIGLFYGVGQNGGDNNVVYQIVGQLLGVFYLFYCKGFKENEFGGYSYDIEDLNDDGEIDFSDGGDRYIVGQVIFKVIIGLNISFCYKFFDIVMQINGVFGYKIFNGMGLVYINMFIFFDYNVLKGVFEKNIIDQNVLDYWLEKGDYVNIEYIIIGYNILMKFKVVKLLCFLVGISNFVIIIGYSGFILMINSYVVSNILGIDDKCIYFLYCIYLLGFSI